MNKCPRKKQHFPSYFTGIITVTLQFILNLYIYIYTVWLEISFIFISL